MFPDQRSENLQKQLQAKEVKMLVGSAERLGEKKQFERRVSGVRPRMVFVVIWRGI